MNVHLQLEGLLEDVRISTLIMALVVDRPHMQFETVCTHCIPSFILCHTYFMPYRLFLKGKSSSKVSGGGTGYNRVEQYLFLEFPENRFKSVQT